MKQIMLDLLGGLKLNQIPIFLIQIIISGFLAWTLEFINKRQGNSKLTLASYAMTLTAVVSLLKWSIPSAICLLAAIVLISLVTDRKINLSESKYFFVSCSFAVAIGAGYGIFSVVAFLPIAFVLWFEEKKK